MTRYPGPEQVRTKYPLWKFTRDLWGFLGPERGRFVLASFFRLAGDLAWLYPAYALASIVTFLTRYTPGEPFAPLGVYFGFWAVAILVRTASQFLCRYIGFEVSERTVLSVTRRGVAHLFLLDMAWHEKENSGNKLKRIQNGASSIDRIFRVWFNSLIEIGVNFVGVIAVIAAFDRTVALAMGAFLLTYFAIAFYLTRRAAFAAYAVGVEEEKVHGLLSEAIGNIRTVKVMAMSASLGEIIRRAMDELLGKIKVRIARFQERHTALNMWGSFFKLGLLAFIAWGVTKGRYEVGFLILFNSYFNDIWQSVGELSDASQDLAVAKYSISRMNETLAEPVRIDREEKKVPFPADWRTISLRNISFAYGKNRVLTNVSFDIKRGERIGIVGLSGAGKSTLFKLLLKEYESGKGGIFFDKLPLTAVSKTDYFRHVSVVLQETEVFNFSLRENITMMNPEKAGDAKLLDRVLHIAHVSDFLKKLPDGLDTLIGERGIKLSGGEKQRLGIARAIFKEPQILLLDEATSHLDLESEEKIRESLHEFFEQVTAIVIAHRLTTIREMDRIVLFEDGQIMETGTFDELYKKKGRFRELWEKQNL